MLSKITWSYNHLGPLLNKIPRYLMEILILYVGSKLEALGPGQVALLVRASSWYTKVAGSIPHQATYKSQPMSV